MNYEAFEESVVKINEFIANEISINREKNTLINGDDRHSQGKIMSSNIEQKLLSGNIKRHKSTGEIKRNKMKRKVLLVRNDSNFD